MHSVHCISASEVEGSLPHFSDEYTEARSQQTPAQGPARSPQLRSCKSCIFLTGCGLGSGPGRSCWQDSVCLCSACTRKSGWGVGSTWRAAETEKPTRPALRWALLSTAHTAAANTSPFPRSSRLAASHLRGGAGNSGVSRNLLCGTCLLGTRADHGASMRAHKGLLHSPGPTNAQWVGEVTVLSHLCPALGLVHSRCSIKLCHAANILCLWYAKPYALVLPQ